MKKLFRKLILVNLSVLLAFAAQLTPVIASSDTQVNALKEKMDRIYTQMNLDERDAFETALNNTAGLTADKVSLIDAVWNKIETAKLGAGAGYDQVTPENVLELFAYLGSIYSPGIGGGTIVDPSQNLKNTLAELVDLSGDSNIGQLTREDLAAYVLALEEKTLDQIPNTLDDLLDMASTTSGIKAMLEQAIQDVMNDSSLDLAFVKLLNAFGITTQDMKAVLSAIAAEVDPHKDSAVAVMLGYARSETPDQDYLGEPFSVSGLTYEYLEVRLMDITGIPVTMFDWQSSTSDVEVDFGGANQDESLLISAKKPNVTATISAFFNIGDADPTNLLDGRLAFTTDVVFQDSGSGTPPAPGPGPGPTPQPGTDSPAPIETPSNPNEVEEEVKEELDNISDGTENQQQKQAIKTVEQAIRKAATLDLSGNVTATDGTAEVALDVELLAESFKQVKEIADAANAALQEKVEGAAPAKVAVTLDLGEVEADSVAVPVPKDLLAAAKEQGIDAVAIRVNGLVIELEVDVLEEDATIHIEKADESVADQATDAKRVSDVYTIEFKNRNNESINAFQQPIKISVPVNIEGTDPDYLVFVKIEDGRIIPYGGKYNPETGEFEAQRTNFSTYTVIENRVTFSDIDSVRSWAGRQIESSAAKGIINGRGDGIYDPQGYITRAEFAALIVRAFQLENSNLKENFADVHDGDWYQPYVAAAHHYGIINGRSASIFDPNANITRAEMATMAANALRNLLGYKNTADMDSELSRFSDADQIHDLLKPNVALMVSEGLLKGKGNGIFDPQGFTTRAEAAVVIYTLFNL